MEIADPIHYYLIMNNYLGIFINKKILIYVKMSFFIEVGSCDSDTCERLINNGWSGIVIEPVKYYYDKLPKYPHIKYENIAISDKKDESEIHYIDPEYIKDEDGKWLHGISSLKGRTRGAEAVTIEAVPERSALKTIGLGFLCNALNPKAPIYFVSLFTIVLSQDTPAQHLLIYGLWMMVLQLAWFSLLTLLLSRPSVTQKFQRLGSWIDRIAGGAMLLLGIKVLVTRAN